MELLTKKIIDMDRCNPTRNTRPHNPSEDGASEDEEFKAIDTERIGQHDDSGAEEELHCGDIGDVGHTRQVEGGDMDIWEEPGSQEQVGEEHIGEEDVGQENKDVEDVGDNAARGSNEDFDSDAQSEARANRSRERTRCPARHAERTPGNAGCG